MAKIVETLTQLDNIHDTITSLYAEGSVGGYSPQCLDLHYRTFQASQYVYIRHLKLLPSPLKCIHAGSMHACRDYCVILYSQTI